MLTTKVPQVLVEGHISQNVLQYIVTEQDLDLYLSVFKGIITAILITCLITLEVK